MKIKHARWAPIGLTLLFGNAELSAQEPTLSLVASSDHFQLGSAFAAAGDLNGDGVTDIAVADSSGRVGSFFASGIVHLVDGSDGSVLRSLTGSPAASQGFGASMATLDVDGDGVPDLAVGSPGQSDASGFGAGAVRIYSGEDGALLWQATGPARSQFGSSLANAGDQDGDGIDDLYVGAPSANASQGAVIVLSGSDGSTVRQFGTDASTSQFGLTLAAVGDIDGDGLGDVVVGAPGFRLGSNPVGRVLLVRGSDGAVVSQIQGVATYNRLGQSLAATADVDNDGVADLLVGSYSGGTALLVSGADLSLVDDLSIPSLPAYRPLTVGGGIDFDGDGNLDWLIGSPGLGLHNGQLVGAVRIVSGVDHTTLFERIAESPYTGLGDTLKILDGFGFAAGEPNLSNPETLGRGAAYLWHVVVDLDSDNDGIPDEDDAVPDSVMDPTVSIAGTDSGVPNRVDDQGVSIADRFQAIGPPADYKNGGLFNVAVLHLANELARAGLLTKTEVRDICEAARSAAVSGPRR